MLRKIYTFLFHRHVTGFIRLCYALLVPCALSATFCRYWLLFMAFLMALSTHARAKGWDRLDGDR